jgi:small subunit ribosomal protein S4
MKRKHKTYSRPKRPFEKVRIEEEAGIKEEFGLKNKREIWRADAKIRDFRGKAKRLISAEPEKQQALFERMKKVGLNVDSIADVLALEKGDYLNRRLQTIIYKKGFAKTIRAARQLIVHKKVLVDGKAVDSPSYLVPVALEKKLTIKQTPKKVVKKEPAKPKEALEKDETLEPVEAGK